MTARQTIKVRSVRVGREPSPHTTGCRPPDLSLRVRDTGKDAGDTMGPRG